MLDYPTKWRFGGFFYSLNACAEGFFHSLKVECIHGERFATRDAMKQTGFEYIETDYNRNRLHSSLGYLSPLDFEAQFLIN